jgi:hypothetical protein
MERTTMELTGSGYGSGYGYGDGDGDGYGDGSGYGAGYGDGDGDGYGSGDGYGYGSGYGDGSGYGSGDGYGYGDGDGDGYGDGSGYGSGYGYGEQKVAYFEAVLKPFREQMPEATVVFWKCDKDGSPANGGSGTKAAVGLVEEIDGPLKVCTAKALHGTLNPGKWKGSHWWIVALHGEVQTDTDKFGALKRTFLADLGQCPFS